MLLRSRIPQFTRYFSPNHVYLYQTRKNHHFHKYSDPYFVLDISRNASKADIKKAYKKMARKYHPDVNKAPDAAEKFQIVHDAYNKIAEGVPPKYDQATDYDSRTYGYPHQGRGNTWREYRSEEGPPRTDAWKHTWTSRDREEIEDILKEAMGEWEYWDAHFSYEAKKPIYAYTTDNYRFKFPRSFGLKEDLSELNNTRFGMQIPHSSLMSDLGFIQHETETKKFTWYDPQAKPVVVGETFRSQDGNTNNDWIKLTTSKGEKVGSLQISYNTIFPIYSAIKMLDANNNVISECTRFALFGTRLAFLRPQEDAFRPKTVLANSMRAAINLSIGREFDIDIFTSHKNVNPALYLFSILHSHMLDVQISPVRAFWRYVKRKLPEKILK